MPKFRRAFSPELKLEAVRQVTEGGRSVPEVARAVGVRPEQLRTWKKQALAAGTVARPLRVESAEDEVRRLQRELEVVRQERDFLKNAAVRSSGRRNMFHSHPVTGDVAHGANGTTGTFPGAKAGAVAAMETGRVTA